MAIAMQPFLETISIRHEPEIPVGASLPQVLQQVFLDRCFDLRLLSNFGCLLWLLLSAGKEET